MPDWFYPLMLVVILAGYVFLFLQARRYQVDTSLMREELTRRLKRLDERVERLSTELAGPREAAPSDPPGLTRMQAGIDDAMASLLAEIEAIRAAVESSRSVVVEAPPAPQVELLPPQAVARRFLLEEGFSQARFGEEEAEGDQTRMSVTALRGDEFRSGYVVVEGQQVVDASLKVPTAFFP